MVKNRFWKGKKFLKEKFIKHINRSNPHIKSIKIVIEMKDGIRTEIPITKYEVFEMSDLGYYFTDSKFHQEYVTIWQKFEHIEHDIIGEGKVYDLNHKLKKERHYLYKKPKWRKR